MSAPLVVIGAIVAVGLIAATAFFLNSRVVVFDRGGIGVPRALEPVEVRPSDFPAIAEAISKGSAKVRYAGLTFVTPDHPNDQEAVNLNLSFENGRVGFDWVLLAPRNVEDRSKFEAFARAHGADPQPRSMNGVSYLRVESGDVAKFTSSIVTQMYGRPSDEPLAMVHDGFRWPNLDSAKGH